MSTKSLGSARPKSARVLRPARSAGAIAGPRKEAIGADVGGLSTHRSTTVVSLSDRIDSLANSGSARTTSTDQPRRSAATCNARAARGTSPTPRPRRRGDRTCHPPPISAARCASARSARSDSRSSRTCPDHMSLVGICTSRIARWTGRRGSWSGTSNGRPCTLRTRGSNETLGSAARRVPVTSSILDNVSAVGDLRPCS